VLHEIRIARIARTAAFLHDLRVVSRALKKVEREEPDTPAIEHALSHWARLVSKFLEMGEPMEDAMMAAARIVSFSRTGPLLLDGDQETRRNAPPESGIRRRVR
jgi:hypothetical protein